MAATTRAIPTFPLRQIAAVIALCKGIMIRRNIPRSGCSAIPTSRPAARRIRAKNFRGTAGQFRRRPLGAAGADHARRDPCSSAPSATTSGTADAFAGYGYGIPVTGKYDGPTMEVVAAFQRHFRPARVDGVADHSTMATLHALLSSLPGDAVNVAAAT